MDLTQKSRRQEEIEQMMLETFKEMGIPDSDEHREIFLKEMISVWKSDEEFSFEKSLYILAAEMLLLNITMKEKLALIFRK